MNGICTMAHVVSIFFYVQIVLHYYNVLLLVGWWFGVAGDEKLGVYFPGIDKSALAEVDACDSGALSQALTELLYTKVEMGTGCATKPRRKGISKLDPKRPHAIRFKCLQMSYFWRACNIIVILLRAICIYVVPSLQHAATIREWSFSHYRGVALSRVFFPMWVCSWDQSEWPI